MVLDDTALDALFRTARTHESFADTPVADETLNALYDLVKFGPTSGNSLPGRFLVIRSAEAKERLRPCLSLGNIEKTMAAPAIVVVAYDALFHARLPELNPGNDLKAWFVGNPDLSEETAFRNSTLQGAYFMLAARALGLVCGPMSGFDRPRLDRIFFNANSWKSNFLINLGYPRAEELAPRLPRLSFEQAVTLT
ncbi:malonic semialdehyde reductase [Acidocella sp.]|uniref:malonic semialdehyde reductase n=1 Tax=Acidocella sp. TaxID=50710 RepID=UPI002604CC3A|nr:malonic semialdehyde reductase [Acidocella sp.]